MFSSVFFLLAFFFWPILFIHFLFFIPRALENLILILSISYNWKAMVYSDFWSAKNLHLD